MAVNLAITSLTDLDPALVAQVQAELTQLLQERHPEIAMGRGVFHDLVLHFSAVCHGVIRAELLRLLQSRSLLAIQADPTLADPVLVDHILSNFNVTRQQGAAATGLLTFVVTGDTSVVLSTATRYTANGVDYLLPAPFVARPPGSVLASDNERVLTSRGDGTYAFTVPATASQLGNTGNLRRGTSLVPDLAPARLVLVYAATDFVGGVDTESNQDLLQRFRPGIAARVLCSRDNIEATLRSQTAFAGALHYSIVGMGNPEMRRDQHGLWPISGGGRVDIYARTAVLPRQIPLEKTAVLVAKQDTQSVWQFAIGRQDAPGFYAVVQIRQLSEPPDVAGLLVTQDHRGKDLSGTDPQPDLADWEEAVYTAYQTAVIQFADAPTALPLGSTRDYAVVVTAMPLIAELQRFCSDPNYRNLAADFLVRAPIPCDLSLACTIDQAAGEPALDLPAIKNAIAATVNGLDFPGQLHLATITGAIQPFLSARQAVRQTVVRGRIRRPDGTVIYAPVKDAALLLPREPSRLTTGRTVALFLSATDITLDVVNQGFETAQ